MKAVIFSDCFFTPEVFEKVVKTLDFWHNVHRVYFDVGWPKIPFLYGNRLREYVPYPREVFQEIKNAEILVTQMGLVDEVLLAHAPCLQVVGCLRSGPVNIDVEALAKRKIPLFAVPERSVEAVAEFTLGLFIAARRRIFRACREAQKGIWSQSSYFTYESAPSSLSETIVGLVGFGQIARRLSEFLAPFQIGQVISYDPYVDESIMERYGVKKVTLEGLLQSSDIVSLHVRYTGDNKGMIGEREFLLMKPGSIFVNTSRGELVDEEALMQALRRGIPAFACIDTYCHEPWEGKHPLAEFENVILTPHIAGASRSTAEIGAKAVAEAVAAYFEGRVSRPREKQRNGAGERKDGVLHWS